MIAWRFVFPASFAPAAEGGFVVTFADLPEAITQGDDEEDARREAADCLDEAIAGRIARGDDIPVPSPAPSSARRIAVSAPMAAKAALYVALREAGISKSELARRLGVDEKEVRRLLDPRYGSKLPAITAALAALGKTLLVDVENAA
jgi:antitoxin HicB